MQSVQHQWVARKNGVCAFITFLCLLIFVFLIYYEYYDNYEVVNMNRIARDYSKCPPYTNEETQNADGSFPQLGQQIVPFILVESVYDDDRVMMKKWPPLNCIPHILHLSWKGNYVPEFGYENIKKWKKLYPKWTIVYWTDKDIHKLVTTVLEGSSLGELFHRFPKNIIRVDFSRYVILYTFGGLYADIDVTPKINMEQVLNHHSCILAREPEVHPVSISQEKAILASNFLMASRPGHPYWPYLMEKTKTRDGYPLLWTGPVAVTDAVKDYMSVHPIVGRHAAVFISPSFYFDPPHGAKGEGDKIHLDMLQERCENFEFFKNQTSEHTKRVCSIFLKEGRMDFTAMFKHPKHFNHSFTRHGKFNSWNSNSGSLVKYKSLSTLPFKLMSPDQLYKIHRFPMTPYEREDKIVNEGIETMT